MQVIPPIVHIFPYRGLSACRLSHSCTLLKPFDEVRCHLAGTLVEYNDALC